MADLMSYAAALSGLEAGGPAPVDAWSPPDRGDIDLVIRSDGTWVHEGAPIRRARLVRLFSTVLKREGDRFVLVTPAEKVGLQVEDAPFTAVLMRIEGTGQGQRIVFTTNMGEEVAAGPEHPLLFRETPDGAGVAPYIVVRRGLEARVARSVYYDLVEAGEAHGADETLGVWSGGAFFPFAPGAARGAARPAPSDPGRP